MPNRPAGLLDRIVGYKISPILTRRVQGGRDGGLSAGRVQSVALKLVVDREKEIEAFNPVNTGTSSPTSQAKKGEQPFSAPSSIPSMARKSKKKKSKEKMFS